MFSTNNKREGMGGAEGHGADATVIARGVRVEGDFVSQGEVVIEGDVNGHVTTSGALTIGSEAKLKADIQATEASVAGTIHGNVTVKGRLELKATANITGDVTCETAVIEAGACLSGKVLIGTAKAAPSNSKSTPSKDNAA
jgi:cytoskeletal protein CcmA (bactofilin family)